MTQTSIPTTHTLLRAQGFSCPSCVSTIEKQLTRLDGVHSATVHFSTGRIEIDHDTDQVTVADLVEAVAKAGYPSAPAAF